MEASLYDFDVTTIDGATQRMAAYRGHTLLIVNVASLCAWTPQYAGLEALYRKYRDAGFVVLGFPCNQFGREEPGTNEEISRFCLATYGVSFPLFNKIDVNGRAAHPLFRYLKSQKRGLLGSGAIKWNFTKFLVDKNGKVRKRYGPLGTPDTIERDVNRMTANE